MRVESTDPYEPTPAEPVHDKLAGKPSWGMVSSVLIRVGLLVVVGLCMAYRQSLRPRDEATTILGLDAPPQLYVAGRYLKLIGGGPESPGAVALYLHKSAHQADDWHRLAPFAASGLDDGDAAFFEALGAVRVPKSLLFLYGLNLDYSDALIGGGFSFHNPNADSTCGCGKSFEV